MNIKLISSKYITIFLLPLFIIGIIFGGISCYKAYKYRGILRIEQKGAKEFAISYVELRNTITLNQKSDIQKYSNRPLNILPPTFDYEYYQLFDLKNPNNDYSKAIKGHYTTSVKVISVEVDNNKTITVYFNKIYTNFKTHKIIKTDTMFANLWYWYTPNIQGRLIDLPHRYHLTAYIQNIQ